MNTVDILLGFCGLFLFTSIWLAARGAFLSNDLYMEKLLRISDSEYIGKLEKRLLAAPEPTPTEGE